MTSLNPLYTPYGAYELKAAYQRNMLLALLFATSFVLLTLLASWLLSHSAAPPPLIPVDPGGPPIEIKIIPPPSITVERAPIDPSWAPPSADGIPDPVPDDEIGDLDMVILSRDERATIIDERYGLDEGQSGTVPCVIDDPTDFIPSPDSFVSMEIYPELIHRVAPEYPRFARTAGPEGTVHIKALVMPDGSVRDALVFGSSKVESLDQVALSVATQNVFKPGIQNGRPVPCWVVYKVEFKLSR